MNNPLKPIEGTTIDSRFEKQTPPIIEVTFGKSPKVTIPKKTKANISSQNLRLSA